jgi:hypothetical protein
LLVCIAAGALASACAKPPAAVTGSPEPDTPRASELLEAPTSVTIDGARYWLWASISIPMDLLTGKPGRIQSEFRLHGDVPPRDVEIRLVRAFLIRRDEVWSTSLWTRPVHYSKDSVTETRQERPGPFWLPDELVDVVVELEFPDGRRMRLLKKAVRIEAAW